MSNLIFKKLKYLKSKTFGLGDYSTLNALIKFGISSKHFLSNKQLFPFVSSNRVGLFFSDLPIKFLQNLILSQSNNYSAPFIKQIERRIELLKFNRSWRGVRHLHSLPVRGQRTKTNARTRKSRRKKI